MNVWLVALLCLMLGGSLGVVVGGILAAASKATPRPTGIPAHRLDAIDAIVEVQHLIEQQRFGAAARRLGISDADADRMTRDQLTAAFEVRTQALIRKAGLS